jgi:hypothetical protein
LTIASHNAPPKAKEELLAAANGLALTITVPSVDVTLNYTTAVASTRIPGCSVSLGGLVETHGHDSTLSVQISSAVLDTKDSLLNEILNKALIPFAIEQLNKVAATL